MSGILGIRTYWGVMQRAGGVPAGLLEHRGRGTLSAGEDRRSVDHVTEADAELVIVEILVIDLADGDVGTVAEVLDDAAVLDADQAITDIHGEIACNGIVQPGIEGPGHAPVARGRIAVIVPRRGDGSPALGEIDIGDTDAGADIGSETAPRAEIEIAV